MRCSEIILWVNLNPWCSEYKLLWLWDYMRVWDYLIISLEYFFYGLKTFCNCLLLCNIYYVSSNWHQLNTSLYQLIDLCLVKSTKWSVLINFHTCHLLSVSLTACPLRLLFKYPDQEVVFWNCMHVIWITQIIMAEYASQSMSVVAILNYLCASIKYFMACAKDSCWDRQ